MVGITFSKVVYAAPEEGKNLGKRDLFPILHTIYVIVTERIPIYSHCTNYSI